MKIVSFKNTVVDFVPDHVDMTIYEQTGPTVTFFNKKAFIGSVDDVSVTTVQDHIFVQAYGGDQYSLNPDDFEMVNGVLTKKTTV